VIALEPELLLDDHGTNVVGRNAVRGALERKLAPRCANSRAKCLRIAH
jgi:hypothetical protein